MLLAMSRATATVSSPEQAQDQRVFLRFVDWSQYEALLAMRGDHSGVRIAYLEGTVELMSPSIRHESTKKLVSRLLEAFAEERGLDLNGGGSWTLEREAQQRGAEPDECYVLGPLAGRDVPDLVIEVVLTSGGLDKLAIYRGLGVGEIWFWIDDHIQVWILGKQGYRHTSASQLLPDLDLTLLADFAVRTDQTAAVREFRDRLHASS